MSKGKGKRGSNKELYEIQTLRLENRKLKKSITSLRKQLKRVDIDRFQNLKDLVIKQNKENFDSSKVRTGKKLRDKWTCRECNEGYLRIIILPMRNIEKYLRKCSNPKCNHKTKTKVFDPSKVEGIFEKEDKINDSENETASLLREKYEGS